MASVIEPNLLIGAKSVALTLSGGAGSVPIGADVHTIGVKPTSSTTIRIGLETPEIDGTATGTALAANLKNGMPVNASVWTWLSIGSGESSRILYITGGASDVIEVVMLTNSPPDRVEAFIETAKRIIGAEHLLDIWPLTGSPGDKVRGVIRGFEGHVFGGLSLASSLTPIGSPAPIFDGTDDYIAISATALNSCPVDIFKEGTAFAYIKPDSSVWPAVNDDSYTVCGFNSVIRPSNISMALRLWMAPLGALYYYAEHPTKAWSPNIWDDTTQDGPGLQVLDNFTTWKFVVTTWSASSGVLKMYVDGVLKTPEVNYEKQYADRRTQYLDLLIGADMGTDEKTLSVTNHFKGGIALIGFADVALSDSDILRLQPA